jgi:Protein of unknown function (DUF935)
VAAPGENLLTALGKLLGLVTGEPTPGTGSVPATPVDLEPMAVTTVQALRATLDEHDRGNFSRSGRLADLILRDADLFGALNQRVLGLQQHPVVVNSPDKDPDAGPAAQHTALVRNHWHRVVSAPAQHDLAAEHALMGFSVAQLLWHYDDELGELVPHLDPWPSYSTEYRPLQRQWYALSRDQGLVPIYPGDGQWVLLKGRSVHRAHLWGAIRCTAEWYLSNSLTANNTRRRAEMVGMPIWAAYLPSGARTTADGKAFVRALRTMGRNAVIPLPRGREEADSYDMKMVEAQVDAFRIFEFLQKLGGGKMRLALLGQDLTSQNNTVGTNASSDNGMDVTAAVIQAEARTFSDVYTDQVAAPWTMYRTGDRRLNPRIVIDADPPADALAEGNAMVAMATAAQQWRGLGVNVDVTELAERAGVPVLPGKYIPPAPPKPDPNEPPAGKQPPEPPPK